MKPEVKGFFDRATCTITYVVADPASRRAAIVDPVLDYDPKAARTATRSADEVLAHVERAGLTVDWLLETHVHADHLSAAPYLKERLGGRTAIGAHVAAVQATFKKLFNLEPAFATDGRQFDHLFGADEPFLLGAIAGRALYTPGHTPDCVTYMIGDAAFVGDTIFMPDYGTARCDFPGGDAATLYRSIRQILALPPATRLFMCHDYMPGGREPRWETSIADEREGNIHVHDGVAERDFVTMRRARDETLGMPVLLLPAVQVNVRAGALPPPEANGVSYLKIPINVL